MTTCRIRPRRVGLHQMARVGRGAIAAASTLRPGTSRATGIPEDPHHRPASRPRGLAPGQLVAGEVDGPRRPIAIGPSPERVDESDRVVEIGLRAPRRRPVGVPLEEPDEPARPAPARRSG